MEDKSIELLMTYFGGRESGQWQIENLQSLKLRPHSGGGGDFYKVKATIPAAEAFRPLKDGGCPLVSG